MKVLLVNAGSLYVKQAPVIPLGLLSIATYLSGCGHMVKLVDRAVESGSFSQCLDTFNPDFVGISAMSFRSFKDAVKLSKAAHKRSVPVVWGGSTVSLVPEVVLRTGVVDFVVIGEGEVTMQTLLTAYGDQTAFEDVEGIAFLKNGHIVVTKERELADLVDFPVIDFQYVDPTNILLSMSVAKKCSSSIPPRVCRPMCVLLQSYIFRCNGGPVRQSIFE
jgi:anaerobic magnesium-protoporphyrin IX monomethyl ester cyclase